MSRILTLIFLLVTASTLNAGRLELSGDLAWTGAPTPDGDTTYPATISMDFGDEFHTANVTLDTLPYAGSWMMEDFGMTSGSSRFFGTTEDVSIELEMNPLAELSENTLADVTRLKFEWAHPIYNDVAPVSWLSIEGAPIVVSEPHGWILFFLAVGALGLALGRARHKS